METVSLPHRCSRKKMKLFAAFIPSFFTLCLMDLVLYRFNLSFESLAQNSRRKQIDGLKDVHTNRQTDRQTDKQTGGRKSQSQIETWDRIYGSMIRTSTSLPSLHPANPSMTTLLACIYQLSQVSSAARPTLCKNLEPRSPSTNELFLVQKLRRSTDCKARKM